MTTSTETFIPPSGGNINVDTVLTECDQTGRKVICERKSGKLEIELNLPGAPSRIEYLKTFHVRPEILSKQRKHDLG